MGKLYETLSKNRIYIVAVVVALVCAWVCYDARRNDRVYNNTEATINDVGKRINSAGERAVSAQKSVTEAEKAVERATERIEAGAERADEIERGLAECENRIDSAIQRNGRIRNIITEIKRTSKERESDTTPSNMAE